MFSTLLLDGLNNSGSCEQSRDYIRKMRSGTCFLQKSVKRVVIKRSRVFRLCRTLGEAVARQGKSTSLL